MMGAALAKAAYAAADALDVREHAPVRAFVFMALTALDTDPRPSFYGGREALAAAIAAPRTASGFKVVRDATSALVARGLISVAGKAAPGRATRYDLLDGKGSPLTGNGARSASTDSETGHAEGAVNNSERGTLSVAMVHGERAQRGTLTVPPKEEEDKEEEGTRASAPPTLPVDNSPSRTCRRHPHWEHDDPCRACAADRRASATAITVRATSRISNPRWIDETCPAAWSADRQHVLGEKSGQCINCADRPLAADDPLADIA